MVSCYVQCSAVNSCKHTNGRLKKKRWKFAYTKVTFIDISEKICTWARWSLGVSKPINCHIIVFNMYNRPQINTLAVSFYKRYMWVFVEWGKISPPFTSKCLYFRTVQLIKKIVLSKTCMVIGTNDSHITYSDVAIISPCFFLICRVADLWPLESNFSHIMYFVVSLWCLTPIWKDQPLLDF